MGRLPIGMSDKSFNDRYSSGSCEGNSLDSYRRDRPNIFGADLKICWALGLTWVVREGCGSGFRDWGVFDGGRAGGGLGTMSLNRAGSRLPFLCFHGRRSTNGIWESSGMSRLSVVDSKQQRISIQWRYNLNST